VGRRQVRGAITGLPTRYPLGQYVPAMYQEDPFTQGLLAGLDDVLSPVLSTLDNLHAYIDPRLAPPDFLAWVASWLGLVDGEDTVERQRALVIGAAGLYGRRGTASALAEWLLLVSGVLAEVEESGGVAFSETPGAPLPGTTEPWVRVRLKGATAAEVAALLPIVRAWVPAHALVDVTSEA
jgi:phage tail-like protein